MTIDHTKVPSTQSNFTVLVSVTDPALKTVANGGHVANANGYDIGFYADSGGSTKLKWEVEKYNGTTGNLIAWVKIPSVSSTTDTPFYLFYGDPSIVTNQSDPVNTWDSNYKAVYHLGNGATFSGTDSTAQNNSTNNGLTAAAGQFVGGATVGSGNYALNSNVVNTAVATVSAWVKANVAVGRLIGFAEGNNGFIADKNIFLTSTHKAAAYGYDTGPKTVFGATTITTGAWHYIVGVFNGTNVTVYIDGSSDGSTACGNTFAGYSNPDLLLGGIDRGSSGDAGSSTYLNGIIDEPRFSSVARSAAWIAAEYNNQNSPGTFITMGSESCPSATPTPTPTTTPTPTPTATPQFAADDFNRADGQLGLNWAKPVPASEETLVIVNNEVTPDIDGAHCYAYWIGNTFSQDQYSQVRLSDIGNWNGVIARAQSAVDRFYMAFVFGPNDYRLYLRKDGLYYTLNVGGTETWVPGDVIRLEAVGLNPVQLTLFRNGNPVLTYTDTTENLVGGSPGIGIWSPYQENRAVDDWEGGSVGMQGIFVQQTQVPSVRGNLVTTALGVSQVRLSWTAPTDSAAVKKYEVQRRDPGSTSFIHAGTTTGISYIDTGLAAGSNYSYRVLVRDMKGRLKKYSGAASVTTASPTIVPRVPR
jgi:hypothetical protein